MCELLDIIDENDNVIGTMTRAGAYRINAMVRIAGVLLFTSSNKIILQQRAPSKTYPLCFDYSAAGHVQSGESYEKTAIAELKEELGITVDKLACVGIVRTYNLKKSNKPRKLHHVFIGVHDGPFSIFHEEVFGIIEMTKDSLRKMITENPEKFTPGFIQIYNEIIVKENLFQINKNICS
jgi:16S rRNA (adenine1518-N6/adenine1519-N6)-dimethyltransferase